MKKNKLSVRLLTAAAICVCLDAAGGQIALFLKLPLLLDNIGTILLAGLCGPSAGMITALCASLLMGVTGDIYSVWFAPSNLLIGLMAGLSFRSVGETKSGILLRTVLIAMPSAVCTTIINTAFFDGVTSSSTTVIVQFLSHTELGLFRACLIVQVILELADRFVSLLIAMGLIRVLRQAGLAPPETGGRQHRHSQKTDE